MKLGFYMLSIERAKPSKRRKSYQSYSVKSEQQNSFSKNEQANTHLHDYVKNYCVVHKFCTKSKSSKK